MTLISCNSYALFYSSAGRDHGSEPDPDKCLIHDINARLCSNLHYVAAISLACTPLVAPDELFSQPLSSGAVAAPSTRSLSYGKQPASSRATKLVKPEVYPMLVNTFLKGNT